MWMAEIDPKTGIMDGVWKDDLSDTKDDKFRICILKTIIINVGKGYKDNGTDLEALVKTINIFYESSKYDSKIINSKAKIIEIKVIIDKVENKDKDIIVDFETLLKILENIFLVSKYTFDNILKEYEMKSIVKKKAV